MKNIKQLFLFAVLGLLCFAQVATGQTISQADATRYSERLAVSPYIQAVPNDSYTFIGVSHPSLDSALTQIGVVLEAVGMGTAQGTRASRSSVFTVDAGETHRVFIVNASHATINSENASFTGTRTHLIPTSNSAQFGSVRLTTVTKFPTTPTQVGTLDKFANLAQLSIWGIVYVESSGAGFAMEFIGDMQDSSVGGNVGALTHNVGNNEDGTNGDPMPGRGIN